MPRFLCQGRNQSTECPVLFAMGVFLKYIVLKSRHSPVSSSYLCPLQIGVVALLDRRREVLLSQGILVPNESQNVPDTKRILT